MIFVSFALIAASMFQVAEPLLGEPWNSLLFLLGFPAAIQLYKLWRSNGGKVPSKKFLQIVSLVVAAVFMYLNDGFASFVWPAFPIMGDDIAAFLGDFIVYVRALTVVVGLAWGAMMALYEAVLKRCFEFVGFASDAKVASRKKVGFWA
jgi:hypothetical protein